MAAPLLAPALGAAAISASASIFSGITGGKGAKKAAKIAAQSAEKDRALATQIYNQNYGLAAPTVERGNAAGSAINALLGLGGNQAAANDALAAYKSSSGYQTRLGEGYDALNAGYAARGALESGAAQKALLKYGQDYASNEFGNYLTQLGNQQGAGLSALGSVTGSGTAYVQQMASANNSAASAQANAALFAARSQQQALSGVADALGGFYGDKSYGNKAQGWAADGRINPNALLSINPWRR